MKSLLLVAYRFPPSGGPAVQRPAKFAKYLPQFGYRPLVLTAARHETKYSLDHSLLAELGDVSITSCRGYEGYGRLLRAVGLGPPAKLLLLPDKEILWAAGAADTAVRLAQRCPIDAIFTTVAPRSCAVLGARLKRLLGVPWVLDYRDPWTTGDRVWPTPLHRWYDVRQERQAVEAADAIVVVTPTMKDLLVEKFPEAGGKTHVICNGFDRSDFVAVHGDCPNFRGEARENGTVPLEPEGDWLIFRPETGRKMSQSPGRLRIAFTGALANVSGLSTRIASAVARLVRAEPRDYSTHSPQYLLKAVRALLDERPDWNDKLELCFAGNFGKHNLACVRQLGLEHVVRIKGYLPHDQSVQLLMDSDVLFLPMLLSPRHRRSYIHSAKTFEYLAAGKPILAAVPEGDARDLVLRARAGWCVEPRDVDAMKELLRRLVQRKLSGTLAIEPDRQYIAQFERRELTRQLAALLDSLTQSESDRRATSAHKLKKAS